jgi:hypothetical protein
MSGDMDESPARLLPGRRRRRPRVSSPSLEASLRCAGISHSLLALVVVFGRKPRSGVGSARWRRSRHRYSVGSIVFGDTAWRSYVVLLRSPVFIVVQDCCSSGAMYVVAGESKTVPFSGLSKSRHPLATSFSATRVDGASIREVSGSSRSSEVTGVGRDVALVHSLGLVLILRSRVVGGVEFVLHSLFALSCSVLVLKILPSIKIWWRTLEKKKHLLFFAAGSLQRPPGFPSFATSCGIPDPAAKAKQHGISAEPASLRGSHIWYRKT